MNVVLFITDQERAIQHFPDGWAAKNLPGLSRLQRNGLTFTRAFTNAAMCSPARSTLLTGFHPAQQGVKYTLEEDMPDDKYPQVELPTRLPNLATVAAAAGYTPVYKGKWHVSKPAGAQFAPSDLEAYGFGRWNPPDGGANQDLDQTGGGTTDHDGRYMDATGDPELGQEGALKYLASQAAKDQPFLLVVSLVNPHDVLMYPSAYTQAGYDDSWLAGDIGLPPTVGEDLLSKPRAQRLFLQLFNHSGPLDTTQKQLDYLNFYGNLMKASDAYLMNLLDSLEGNGLLDSTLVVRTSDHGEMGLAHGGLRQKNFNFYEESVRVPLVFSNPKLFRKPSKTTALVSHLDFLPTMASFMGAPRSARAKWPGIDYSARLRGTGRPQSQSSFIFTYDDFQAGQARGPYVPQPNHIVGIRETRWKIARYYDPSGAETDEWELYDLKHDPYETVNLAAPGRVQTPEQAQAFQRMRKLVANAQATRLKPLV